MIRPQPKVLVVAGDGINCEVECAQAFKQVGFKTQTVHLNDLISDHLSTDALSKAYPVLALPGGFSFGDDLGSGKVLALKLGRGLSWDLAKYAERGGLVIGICNGFQALIRMGIFGKDVSITHNSQGKFVNTWVKVTPWHSQCVWLKGLGSMDLPIRHGEGRVVIGSSRHTELMYKMETTGMTCLRYESDVNGSDEKLAGLCDVTGRIFGLMPHPEAFVRWTAHPEWTAQPGRADQPGHGLGIFENAFREANLAQI